MIDPADVVDAVREAQHQHGELHSVLAMLESEAGAYRPSAETIVDLARQAADFTRDLSLCVSAILTAAHDLEGSSTDDAEEYGDDEDEFDGPGYGTERVDDDVA